MHITHPKTNNNNSTAGHEKCFYFRIFIHVPPKHIIGKLSAPRDIHMTSHFGYLVLLITRTFFIESREVRDNERRLYFKIHRLVQEKDGAERFEQFW